MTDHWRPFHQIFGISQNRGPCLGRLTWVEGFRPDRHIGTTPPPELSSPRHRVPPSAHGRSMPQTGRCETRGLGAQSIQTSRSPGARVPLHLINCGSSSAPGKATRSRHRPTPELTALKAFSSADSRVRAAASRAASRARASASRLRASCSWFSVARTSASLARARASAD